MNSIKNFFTEKFHNVAAYFADEMISLEAKSFFLVLVFGIPVTVIMFLGFLLENVTPELTIFAGAVLVMWIVVAYLSKRFDMHRFFAYVIVIASNFFVFPIAYFLSGDIFGGAGLFFLIGFASTFFLISSRNSYVIFALEVLLYVYIFDFTKEHWLLLNIYRTKMGDNSSMMLCFVVAAVIPVLAILYQTDVYEQTHKRVLKSRQMVEEARINRTRFVSNMTQDIRTPINAIVGMNEIILREDLNPVAKELIEQIRGSSAELLNVINNILEFSKIDSDKLELHPQRYSFKALVSGVIESVANAYTEEETRIYVKVDPTIPMLLFGDDIRIRQVFMYLLFSSAHRVFDSRIIFEIDSVRDLSDNSILLKCRVSESGLGLSDAEIDAMLSAYTRYDSRQKSDYKGMGLELSICKEILEKMGGSLTVESVEGVGTTLNFTFRNYILDEHNMVYLDPSRNCNILIYAESKMDQKIWQESLEGFHITPKFVYGPNALKNAIEDVKYSHIFIPESSYDILGAILESYECEESTYVLSSRTKIYSDFGKCRLLYYPISCINIAEVLNGVWDEEKYKLASKADAVIFPKAKILIVDDSLVNLKVLKGILKAFQIIPDMAQNAQEALNFLNTTSYELIVLDQFMPDTDGVELLNRIKTLGNSNNKVPVICATSDFGPEVERRLKAEGFQDYLAKPIRKHYLERTLRRFLPKELAVNVSEVETVAENSSGSAITIPNPEMVDFALGLENIGGSLEAYSAVLNAYYREGRDKLKSVPAELEESDLNLYVIDVHALKSSSASIGAPGLSLLFKELEFAGRDNNREFVNSHTMPTLMNFETVLDKVKVYLTDNNLFEQESTPSSEKSGEVEDISLESVLEMQNAINTINLRRCEEIINELNDKNFGPEVNQYIMEIKSAYDMFDYNRVKGYIVELIDYIKS